MRDGGTDRGSVRAALTEAADEVERAKILRRTTDDRARLEDVLDRRGTDLTAEARRTARTGLR